MIPHKFAIDGQEIETNLPTLAIGEAIEAAGNEDKGSVIRLTKNGKPFVTIVVASENKFIVNFAPDDPSND